MSKKTLALIVSLVLLTVALLAVALSTKQPVTGPTQKQGEPTVTPTPPAHTILNLTPATLIATTGANQIQVQINTEDNQVTAVQLEIAYDPQAISNVRLTPGTFFTNPVVLLNNNDAATGRISYALAIAPAQDPANGTGTVATISFTPNASATVASTEISLLDKSLVAARGVVPSVLKQATGTKVTLPTRGQSTTTPASQTTPQTVPVTAAPTQ